ncbi:hypothetical protein RA224_09370 [Achromobacter aegrifaciens]|uniref:hypothetical protein n=1 Tax=Achromobacter aegrifaciens TaxID=1287736 RepID=UPI0027B98813|nr:hypothetical protein [Achromobacter aegrifaciens]WLW63611.1 hypothetical protein RA224_09370 [Achromobacter aegrifaciens]
MSKAIDLTLTFMTPAGIPGVLRLAHTDGKTKTALLSVLRAESLDAAAVSAPLTACDMRQLVDGLVDAINAIERHDRLSIN